MLTQEEDLAGPAALHRDLLARLEALASPRRVLLDMDSTEIRVCGGQERRAYNGHFESICHHPLLLFSREVDCLVAKLRPGNVQVIAPGGELPDAPVLCRHATNDHDAVVAAGIK